MSGAPITPKFQTKAPQIMQRIMDALELSDEDAAAVLGNFGTETGGFTLREEEGKPNKDTRGYGWAQWTGMDPGERRRLFEDWCKAYGFSDVVANPKSCPEERYDAACLGYFVYEASETWEKRVFEGPGATINGVFYKPVPECDTLAEKTTSFMRLYERPGTPHEDWRQDMAEEALRLYRGEEEEDGVEEPPMRVVISSGHGLYVRGANGILDEVDEARRVVEGVADELRNRDVNVKTFHDNVSKTQSENLKRIADFHNAQTRDLDISVHFNAYEQVEKPMGTEVLYVTQASLAATMSAAIASVGFINRGAKKRTDLYFLNNTEMPAILLEICFVDSEADAEVYGKQFDAICDVIADVLGGDEEELPSPEPEPEPEVAVVSISIEAPAGVEVQVVVNGEPIS